MAVLGFLIVTKGETMATFIPVIIGVLIFVNGVMNLVKTNKMRQEDEAGWKSSCVLSLISIAFGTIVFANPFSTVKVLIMTVGVSLMYTGFSNLWIYRK